MNTLAEFFRQATRSPYTPKVPNGKTVAEQAALSISAERQNAFSTSPLRNSRARYNR